MWFSLFREFSSIKMRLGLVFGFLSDNSCVACTRYRMQQKGFHMGSLLISSNSKLELQLVS